jgi:hypothetical protein
MWTQGNTRFSPMMTLSESHSPMSRSSIGPVVVTATTSWNRIRTRSSSFYAFFDNFNHDLFAVFNALFGGRGRTVAVTTFVTVAICMVCAFRGVMIFVRRVAGVVVPALDDIVGGKVRGAASGLLHCRRGCSTAIGRGSSDEFLPA